MIGIILICLILSLRFRKNKIFKETGEESFNVFAASKSFRKVHQIEHGKQKSVDRA